MEETRLNYSPVCLKCKHLIELDKCKAFVFIPEVIWNGENDHKKPYPGDNGIQFEPIDENKTT